MKNKDCFSLEKLKFWFYSNKDFSKLYWKKSPCRPIPIDREVFSHRVKCEGEYFNTKKVIAYLKTNRYYEKQVCINCNKDIPDSNLNRKFCNNQTCGVSWRTKNIYRYKFTHKHRSASPHNFMKSLLQKKKEQRKNLKIENLLDLWEKQNGLCAVSGRKMTHIAGKGRLSNNISIDRIDNHKEYTLDNIQLVTCDSNRIKGILEMEELYNLCEDILNKRRGKLGNKVRVVSKKVNRSKQPKRDGSQD